MKSPRGVRTLPSEHPSRHLEAEGDDKWENKVYHRISQVGRDKDPSKDHASPTPSATSSTKNEVTFPPWGTTSITHGMWDAGYPTRSKAPAQLLLQRQEMPPARLGELDTESFCKARPHLLWQPMHFAFPNTPLPASLPELMEQKAGTQRKYRLENLTWDFNTSSAREDRNPAPAWSTPFSTPHPTPSVTSPSTGTLGQRNRSQNEGQEKRSYLKAPQGLDN